LRGTSCHTHQTLQLLATQIASAFLYIDILASELALKHSQEKDCCCFISEYVITKQLKSNDVEQQ